MIQNKVIWLYGLSGAGKTTIALALKNKLEQADQKVVLLDGDVLREGLNKDLGFESKQREENIRRVSEVAKLLCDNGIICICSLITPLQGHRDLSRQILQHRVIHIFVDCPLSECENRDVKGLYAKARSLKITNFTGVSSPFEIPGTVDLKVDTLNCEVDESVNQILQFLAKS